MNETIALEFVLQTLYQTKKDRRRHVKPARQFSPTIVIRSPFDVVHRAGRGSDTEKRIGTGGHGLARVEPTVP